MIVGIQTAVFAASQLEEAAIKEGKVIWYGAWPKKLMDKVAKAFEAKYPKIDVMVFRSGSSKVAAKFAAEKEAGAVLCDVFTVSDLSIYLDFKEKGFLEKYTPEEFNKFGEQFRDPDGYWVTPRVYVVGIWYNVENLKKAGLEPPLYQRYTQERQSPLLAISSMKRSGAGITGNRLSRITPCSSLTRLISPELSAPAKGISALASGAIFQCSHPTLKVRLMSVYPKKEFLAYNHPVH
jgi:hypothetical protein